MMIEHSSLSIDNICMLIAIAERMQPAPLFGIKEEEKKV